MVATKKMTHLEFIQRAYETLRKPDKNGVVYTGLHTVFSGFNEAFSRGGLWSRKRGVELSIRIKPPMAIDADASIEQITAQIGDAIEQSEAYAPVDQPERAP